jgi:hypothetical protein
VFDRYTDDELRLLNEFLQLTTTLQGRYAARVERMRTERDRDSRRDRSG